MKVLKASTLLVSCLFGIILFTSCSNAKGEKMKMDNHKHSCLSRSRILFHFRIPISTGKRNK